MSPLEVLITKAALIAGAGFFLWKLIAGWLVVNLEISIEIERQSETEKDDLLAFKILFKKGNTDTLQIKDIQVRVRTDDESVTPIKIFTFSEIQKLRVNKNVVDWTKFHEDGKNISLSPSETFHFGRYLTVPASLPVIVEGVLFGTRPFWEKGFQWRASLASLPIKKEKQLKV